MIVVDDDSLLHDWLGCLFESVELPVRCFGSVAEFETASPAVPVGCVLLDVRLPGASGLDLLSRLAQFGIGLPAIVMTAYANVRMAVRALKNGAFDFIEKPIDEQELLDVTWRAIRHSEFAAREERRRTETNRLLASLTGREREVLDLVAAGEPNKQIAYRLAIGEKTVEFHRANVMRKLAARSVADLIHLAEAARD